MSPKFGESVQATVFIIVTLAVVYSALSFRSVSQELSGGWLLILGWYFGTRLQAAERDGFDRAIQATSANRPS